MNKGHISNYERNNAHRSVGQNWLPLPIPWSLSKIKNKKKNSVNRLYLQSKNLATIEDLTNTWNIAIP